MDDAVEVGRIVSDVDLENLLNAGGLEGLFRIDDEVYHGGPGIGSTGIKRILKSPAHFLVPMEDSDALRRGRMIHEAMLQPKRFASRYVYEPKSAGPKNRNPWKADWEAFKAEAALCSREIISHEDAAIVQGVCRSLEQSEPWEALVDGAELELAAYSPAEGILRKAKADIWRPDLIADLKTTEDASPEAFAWACARFGYHISAAYYLDVFSAVLGQEISTFVWIVVEKSPPYGIMYYVSTPEMLRIGRMEYQRALKIYAECKNTDNWPCYPPEFVPIELPTSYTRKFQE